MDVAEPPGVGGQAHVVGLPRERAVLTDDVEVRTEAPSGAPLHLGYLRRSVGGLEVEELETVRAGGERSDFYIVVKFRAEIDDAVIVRMIIQVDDLYLKPVPLKPSFHPVTIRSLAIHLIVHIGGDKPVRTELPLLNTLGRKHIERLRRKLLLILGQVGPVLPGTPGRRGGVGQHGQHRRGRGTREDRLSHRVHLLFRRRRSDVVDRQLPVAEREALSLRLQLDLACMGVGHLEDRLEKMNAGRMLAPTPVIDPCQQSHGRVIDCDFGDFVTPDLRPHAVKPLKGKRRAPRQFGVRNKSRRGEIVAHQRIDSVMNP